MENRLIVIAFLAQFDEIFARFRRNFAVELEVQRTDVGHQPDVTLFLDPRVSNGVVVQNRRLLHRPRIHGGRRDAGRDQARRIIRRIYLQKKIF